jgi:hypothetical protein
MDKYGSLATFSFDYGLSCVCESRKFCPAPYVAALKCPFVFLCIKILYAQCNVDHLAISQSVGGVVCE